MALTKGIANGEGKVVLIALVLILIFVVNAGYGGGFSNVPTLLSDHYGMGSISAIHGITLSAWAFAGLSGNQLATFIVKHTGEPIVKVINGVETTLNPMGYQNVLYVTGALYVLALVVCFVLVKPSNTKGEKKA